MASPSKPNMKKMMGAMMKVPMEAPEPAQLEGPQLPPPKPKKKGTPKKGKAYSFSK